MNILRELNNKKFFDLEYIKGFFTNDYKYNACFCISESDNPELNEKPCFAIEVRRKVDDSVFVSFFCLRDANNNYFRIVDVQSRSISIYDYAMNKYISNDFIIYCKSKLNNYRYGEHIER